MGFTSGCNHLSFSHPWRTRLAYLVALHLLHLGSAQFRVVAPNLRVSGIVGQDVVLRCHLSPCKNVWSSDIRWIKYQSSGLVHHYQNGEDLEQMEEYKGRTELLRDGLIDGILDLRITAVSSVDSGSYICTVQDGDGYAEDMLNLDVSDPFSQIVHPWKVALAVVITLLVGSSVVFIVFLHRKQAAQSRELKGKDAALERKDALLVVLSRMSRRSDAKLDLLSAKLVEMTNKFDNLNLDLKVHYGIMNLRSPMLKNQVAELEAQIGELVEQTEASETSSEESD